MNAATQAAIDALRRGETVEYSERGNSMTPIIASRQPVTLAPVSRPLAKDDVVLVKVRGNIYTHKVLALRRNKGAVEVQIGNNRGGVNGWTSLSNVYGIVTAIDGVPYKARRGEAAEKRHRDVTLGVSGRDTSPAGITPGTSPGPTATDTGASSSTRARRC